MTLRCMLIFLALLLAPASTAQSAASSAQPDFFGLRSGQACASLGRGEDPSDINLASCSPFSYFNRIDPQHRILWVTGKIRLGPDATSAPIGLYTGALASREIWWNGERIGAAGRVGASRDA